MRRFALLLILLTACTKPERGSGTLAGNPPVILISVDTLRSDHLPMYGYRGVATPNFDALRQDSILFERAYSHCPMTLPSHLSMFTGLLPAEHGVRNNIGYQFDAEKYRTLGEVLRERGYRTGAAVSSYVLRSETGVADGFDFYDDAIPVATAGAVSAHQRSGYDTLKAAGSWLGMEPERPFFFFFHIYEPHAPYAPPEPFRSQYAASQYDGEIAAADAIVGKLIAQLKASGVYDRALIVFLSDHGEGLWDHGEDQHGILLYREALQVPLLVKLPRADRKGTSVAQPVALASVFATITGGEGSLLNAVLPDKPIYAETLYPRIHLGWSELRSLIDARHHFIDGPRPELYDVAADPAETRDLASTERRVAAALRGELAKYPSKIEEIGAIDPEEAAKLAALGYVGKAGNREGPLPNPRDEVAGLGEIKAAFRLADERRNDEAIAALRKLLARNPRLADVWSKLGELLVGSGRAGEAVDAYQSAIAQTERFSPDLALGLAFALLESGKPTEAAQHAQLALASSPREAHELLARALLAQGRRVDAEQHVHAAIEAGDRQPRSILLLAEVQRAAGRYAEALQTIDAAERRARELEVPHLYGAAYLRGDVLARLDRPDEAMTAYRQEIAHSPDHLQSYANLAIIEMILGNRSAAMKTLDEMAKKNPHRGAYALAAKTLEAFGDERGAARWRGR
ncbi:MAG TPA: sulfatase-like hydrolase/transferase [Thermoanaerobaculia bacterium]|nr:sulfatase-like hydrolase/transferase [Thermoanaerobaculia bacterium]